MVDAVSIAVTGLNDASLRVNSAASNIANVSSETADGKKYAGTRVTSSAQPSGGVASQVVARPEGSEIDLAEEVIALKVASFSYQADAKILAVVDENHKKLLDTLA